MSAFTHLKQTLYHASIYGVVGFLQKGIGFFMIPVYTRYLSPRDYGLLELIELFLMVASMLATAGLSGAVIRFFLDYDDEQDRREVLATALLGVLALSVGIAALSLTHLDWISATVLGSVEHRQFLVIALVSLVLQNLATVPEGLLLAEKRSREFSTITLLTFVSYLTFNILFVVGMQLGVLGMVLSTAITKLFNNVLLYSRTWQWFRPAFSLAKLRRMLAFGLPLIPASAAMYAVHYADRFFIQRYCPPDDLGFYSLGYKFGMIVGVLFAGPIFNIWSVQSLELSRKPGGAREIGRLLTYIWALLLLGGLAVAVPVREAVAIMAPEQYQGAARIVGLIVGAYMLQSLSSIFSLGIAVSFKTQFDAYTKLATAAVTIALNFLLVPALGIWGAALATLLTFGFLAAGMYMVSQRLYRIEQETGRLARLTLAALGVYAASQFVGGGVVQALAVKGLLVASFFPLLWIMGFYTADELAKARELAGRSGGLLLRAATGRL